MRFQHQGAAFLNVRTLAFAVGTDVDLHAVRALDVDTATANGDVEAASLAAFQEQGDRRASHQLGHVKMHVQVGQCVAQGFHHVLVGATTGNHGEQASTAVIRQTGHTQDGQSDLFYFFNFQRASLTRGVQRIDLLNDVFQGIYVSELLHDCLLRRASF